MKSRRTNIDKIEVSMKLMPKKSYWWYLLEHDNVRLTSKSYVKFAYEISFKKADWTEIERNTILDVLQTNNFDSLPQCSEANFWQNHLANSL